MKKPIERPSLVVALLTVVACGTGGEASTSTVTGISPTTTATTTTTALPTTTIPALPEPITSAGAAVVDLADREQARIDLLGGPDWLVEGFGSVWVKVDRGDVRRIDPATNSVVAEIPVSVELCQGIGASVEAIWSCSREPDQPTHIERIDPTANENTATIEVGKTPDQGNLVYARGQIWVLNGAGDGIMGIDPATNSLGAPISLGTRCTDLDAAGDVVWAVCPIEGLVVRIGADNVVTASPAIFPNARQVSVADFVFVSFDSGIAQLDSDSMEVLALYDVHPGPAGAILAANDAVWVRRDVAPFLTRIDTVNQTVVETIEAEGPLSPGDMLLAFDSLWTTAFNDNVLVRLALG
jgi:hypothetical protein